MLKKCIAEYSAERRRHEAGGAAPPGAPRGRGRALLGARGGSVGAALLYLAAGLGYGWAVGALLTAGARPDMRVRALLWPGFSGCCAAQVQAQLGAGRPGHGWRKAGHGLRASQGTALLLGCGAGRGCPQTAGAPVRGHPCP